jgi:LuxR family maltose regulon positive regulatory protein
VRREALIERLRQGQVRKLTLLSAPPGYGKTTLVVDWIREVAATQEPGDPARFAWVRLDAADNDPARFARYLFGAIQDAGAEAGRDALAAAELTQFAHLEAAFAHLINALAGQAARYVLVLEDYQALTHAPIHDALAFLLEHQPSTLQMVILTRSDPPLSLARLRARNEINELRAAELRFSAAEAREFLHLALPFELSAEKMERLIARSEGWAAGLRLAALGLLNRPEPEEQELFLNTFFRQLPAGFRISDRGGAGPPIRAGPKFPARNRRAQRARRHAERLPARGRDRAGGQRAASRPARAGEPVPGGARRRRRQVPLPPLVC